MGRADVGIVLSGWEHTHTHKDNRSWSVLGNSRLYRCLSCGLWASIGTMVERRVDMVRLEREDVYDREEVLGRDATSVFPKQSKAATLASASAGQLDADAIREMLGARRFLDSIKKQRGESVDDGTATAPLKPLVEVLREAKEQKEASFAAKWKQMKTGEWGT
ncbi:Nefa_Nip30_N domain-containing protein, partial [Haematococcus lacustris]